MNINAGHEYDNHKRQVEYNLQRLQDTARQLLAHTYPADLSEPDRRVAMEDDAIRMKYELRRFVDSAMTLAGLAQDLALELEGRIQNTHTGFPALMDDGLYHLMQDEDY